VRHGNPDGQSLGEGVLERLKAVEAEAGAEAHHRGLADPGGAGHGGHAQPHRPGRVLQDQLGDLALRWSQLL
jgi:hypothetical protein